jgi:hypothetical protein
MKYPEKVGVFEICDWDNDVEEHDCQNCGAKPSRMYFRADPLMPTTGDYWCYTCAEEETELSEDVEE